MKLNLMRGVSAIYLQSLGQGEELDTESIGLLPGDPMDYLSCRKQCFETMSPQSKLVASRWICIDDGDGIDVGAGMAH